MLIDFSNMEPEIIPHFVGGEGEIHAKMHVDGLNRILHGILPPGSSIGYHTHETSSEIVYILSGRWRAARSRSRPGTATTAPRGRPIPSSTTARAIWSSSRWCPTSKGG